MQPILNLQNVSLTYHSLMGETVALKNINLTVKNGEFIAIVGPSGCGKTTILSLISGLILPTTGTIFIENDRVTKTSDKTGYMFQKDHLFEWRTIMKNILLGLEIKKNITTEKVAQVNELIEKYGLSEFKNYYPSELSGGMRQRVALIRTLSLNPKILLLDEPFSALDYQTRLEVCNDVSKIIKQEKKTAIFVTHDIAEAISMADRILILSERPAVIKKTIVIPFSSETSPLKKRENPEFRLLFEQIYEELKK
ncbi:MAG: spermidine/putrescine ABC transporter ATP-binding protein [Tenericutes bacterium HGW-Tenericutes-4]|jgi:NitT/TauT family transport system ATP-binding protein|nr:MAG: spermidine/putrescine ABC transporter ATP-binding protein [Tenericutes bacterium HGW-Tenericutes-4]